MANKIQLRRGLKANLPTLAIGEPAFCTDTKEFYIGTASGNAKMSSDPIDTSGFETTAGSQAKANAALSSAKSYADTVLTNSKSYTDGLVGNINDSALDASVKGKSLTNMIKVLFQNVNNGKNSVYSAIVDKGTTPASKDFADLVAGISAINTGKKWASGTTSAGSQTSFEYADGSDTGSAYPLKLPITFEPSLVLAVSHVASYYVAVYSNIYDGYYSKTAKVIQYIGSSSHDKMVANYKGDVSPAGLTSGGFTIPAIGSSWVYNWIAIE
ncbi:MAG: hypothetical protein LKE46_00255 [Clostridium sp.]|jgi:hypothetical protein|uniref:hyaluronate lyase N-terminal domain-containing protein n=1 Tax=Clostridium sp. TaxID=1506 RepID=UPI0025B95CCD|nr:hypothetical protein [Clostridium sp.]MCH3962699.1 hypothetical protein [Clostridium sp.]MCI2201084.1 hypothetical protein [Clostridium sp.]